MTMTKKKMMKTMKTTTNNFLLVVGTLFVIGSTAIFVLCMVLFFQNSQSYVVTNEGVVEGESVTAVFNQSDVVAFRHLYKSQMYQLFDKETLSADSVVLMDVKTGDILISKNENDVHPIASLSKLVTALFLFEKGFNPEAKGEVDLETINTYLKSYNIPLSAKARVSKITVEKPESFSATDLLHATLISSANNATFALVQSQGIEPDMFQKDIAAYLVEHNFVQTVIKDPTGLNPENVSTALEFGKLSLAAFNYADIRNITTMASAEIASTSSSTTLKVQTTDRLLDAHSQEILAGKTGYLDEAQYTFVALVRHESGRELLLVMFGADSSSQRFDESKRIIEWANQSYQ
jgi:D-alanyl-D-alanine carboxypeptidase